MGWASVFFWKRLILIPCRPPNEDIGYCRNLPTRPKRRDSTLNDSLFARHQVSSTFCRWPKFQCIASSYYWTNCIHKILKTQPRQNILSWTRLLPVIPRLVNATLIHLERTIYIIFYLVNFKFKTVFIFWPVLVPFFSPLSTHEELPLLIIAPFSLFPLRGKDWKTLNNHYAI